MVVKQRRRRRRSPDHSPNVAIADLLLLLSSEIERHDGLMIMATNRPQDLDDAMQRRISMVFEFPKPDHLQRVEIWKSQLPSQVVYISVYGYYAGVFFKK